MIFPMLGYCQNNNDEDLMFQKGVDTTKYIPKGLQIGAKAPEFFGTSVDGKKINSKEVLNKKKIVLIFYRGKWCPVCNRYLSNLSDSLEDIEKKGAKVIVVGPETFENAEKTVDKTKASFVLLPDTDLTILKNYDVLFYVTKKYQAKIKTFLLTDIAKNNNQEEAILPVPATYIIEKDGIIKWRQFDYDYSKRATVKDIIENL